MKHWPTIPLSQVVTCLDSERIPIKEDDREKRFGSVPYYGANGRVGWIDEAIFNEPLLLIAEDGGHFGEPERGVAYTIRGPSWVNNHAHVLRPDESRVLLDFLGYHFRHFDFQPYITGTTRAKLTQRDLMRIEISMPPVVEQARMVKLLDEADELRNLRAEADSRTAALIPALFREMFGDIATDDHKWGQIELIEVISKEKHSIKRGPFGGAIKKEIFVPDGFKIYEQKNAIRDDFKIGTYFIDESKYRELESFSILPGDLIVSCSGTIGRVAIVPTTARHGIINQALLKLRLDKAKALPLFFKHLLETDYMQNLIFGGAAGSAIKNVMPLSYIKKVRFPLPPLSLQEKFVQRVTGVFALEAEQATSRYRLDDLFQSMLHGGFNGEL